MNDVIDNPAIGGIRLCLGGNVFGWTADRDTSFAILDRFYAAGGRMIDTADTYSAWVPRHVGGESETILGEWIASRGNRAAVRIATKTNGLGKPGGLAPNVMAAALAASLERLQTDYVDLFYSHRDDPETPVDVVVGGLDALVRAGKVRALGASNFSAERLTASLDAAAAAGATPYTVVQNLYNLVARDAYEGAVQDLCVRHGIAGLPYAGLASGFLTGKYRSAADLGKSPRGGRMPDMISKYLPLLAAMDTIAAETGATLAQIALAWVDAQPGVTAPIVSATSVAQLEELLTAASVTLSLSQLNRLREALTSSA